MKKVFTRWNFATLFCAAMLICVTICIKSFLSGNQTNGIAYIIISVIIFGALSGSLGFFQWLFPFGTPPKISRNEGIFSIIFTIVSIIIVLQIATTSSWDALLGIQAVVHTPSTDPSFTDFIKNQQTKITGFTPTQWDNGNQSGGSCSPNAQTQMFSVVTNTSKGNFSCMLLPTDNYISGNMAVEVTANISVGHLFGVTFEDNDQDNPHHNFYRYTIDTYSGEYQLFKGVGNKSNRIENGGTPSGFLQKGLNATNRLEVVVKDQRICLFANRYKIHCISGNDKDPSGTFGLYAGYAPVNVTFSYFTVWQLSN